MKRFALLFASALLVLAIGLSACTKPAPTKEAVVLTMGSWRADDVDAWTKLLAEYKTISGVEIQYKPTNPADYNSTLRLQFENGTAPDIMTARSYAAGAELLKSGYFEDITNLKNLNENFGSTSKAAWTDANGKAFGVPVAAIIQSVYYNKDLFDKAGVKVPETWEDFLAVCDKLQKAGITPLANGLADEWDINECFMMGILPGFVGGEQGRLAYEKGERPFNDANMVAAFKAMGDAGKYCAKGFEALTYNDSNALFATGKAAMYADGSWTLDAFKNLPFAWGNFAFPSPKGKPAAICFHADLGLAMNANGKHKAEARAFLEWLCTKEGASIVGKYLPTGFYPMIKSDITISDPHSAEIYGLLKGREQDVRFVWPKLTAGDPSGYKLMNDGVISVMKGKETAKQAADKFAEGVAKFYKP